MVNRTSFSWLALVLLLSQMMVVGCGTGTSGSNKVPATLTSIAITPPSVTLSVGVSQQLHVIGTYSDGSQPDVTGSATWTSSSANVANISASGMLNAVAPGSVSVTAKLGALSSPAVPVTVISTTKSLTAITITPNPLSISVGGKQQLTATGHYSDSTQADLTTTVNWTSSNGSMATVNTTGTLFAIGVGIATITATSNSITATLAAVVTGTRIGVNVPTWHFDNARTGLNPLEANLTTANVNTASFGKLFSYLVDGYLYAQPLYVSNLSVGGAAHNVVFVATENASVYAFDADSFGTGAPLWHVSLLRAGETPQPGGSVKPFQGITSTPAIDVASNTMYVVSAQQAGSSTFFRLHALDLITGAEKPGSPIVINATYPGTNAASVNGLLTLTTACIQRPALLLANNSVYIGFAACKSSGWMLSYDAHSLAQTGVIALSPNIDSYGKYDGTAGVWMGGAGPAADSSGSVYIVTGDGPYDGKSSFGNTVMKFNAQLKLLDHFAPENWAFTQCDDTDLGSGGVLLLPGTSQALVGGKTGKLYMLNSANLGGLQANDAGVTQSLWFEQDFSPAYSASCTDNHGVVLTSQVTGYQIFGTASFFNGSVYLGITPSQTTTRGPVRQFTYANGQLTQGSVTPDNIAPNSFGTTAFISANGTTNGIVWVLDHGLPIEDPDNVPATAAVLRAYDATDLTKELYNSAQNAGDAAGLGIKFTSPIVANGKVFIGTGHNPVTTPNPQGELDIYGLR